MPDRADAPGVKLTATQLAGCAKLARETLTQLGKDMPWFAELTVQDRVGVGQVAESGIVSFAQWYVAGMQPTATSTSDFFTAAPAHLARAVTLKQTLNIIRVSVDAVEQHATWLKLPGRDREVREAALRYSRDVAFAAAEVYAHAAEVRGAWDARLEALLVDSLLRDDADESVPSLTSALGWRDHPHGLVIAADAPSGDAANQVAAIRRAAAASGTDCLVGLHSRMLMVVLAGEHDPAGDVRHLLPFLEPGPVVLGPPMQSMADAGLAARAARAGWQAAAAWPSAPRPVAAEDLLPERLLSGDPEAELVLEHEVFGSLNSDPVVRDTVAAYLENGKSLEATGRALFVHTNTVRYRLRKATELTGWDPTEHRDGYVLQLALTLGRLSDIGL